MAQEPFLINPPKRLRRRRNPVGETLVTIGMNPSRRNPMKYNPWVGDPEGHRIAALMRWGKIRRGKIGRHRPKAKHGGSTMAARKRVVRGRRWSIDRRTKSYRAMRLAQQREAASFLSMFSGKGKRRKYRYKRGVGYVRFRRNPIKHRRYGMARRRKRYDNAWFGQIRRHKKAAKKGWRRGHHIGRKLVRHYNPRRRRHYRKYRDNPAVVSSNPRRHSRRYRDNPNIMGAFTGKGGLTDVGHWGPLALTGSVSAMTTQLIPGFIGLQNPFAQIGTKLVVAFGGGAAVGQMVGRDHGNVWMLVGVSLVAYQLLKQFVLMPFAPQFAVSLGDESGYQDYYGPSDEMVSQQVGAFPQAISAYPQEISAYPGVGADQEMVGAYPYDGRY